MVIDPDAATGCADDFLPGTADDWRDAPDRVEASQGYRDWVLSLIRCFSPDKPMMVGPRVMADCRDDPDLSKLVDEGLIREVTLIPIGKPGW